MPKNQTSVSSFHVVRDAVETTTAEVEQISTRFLPLAEVAEILGKSEDAVRMAIHRGTFPIPSEVILGRRVFRVEHIHRYLSEDYLRGLEGLSKAKDRVLPFYWEER